MVFQPQVGSGDEFMFTATGAVTAGVPVVVGGMVLLPVISGVSGATINAKLTGVHQLAKKASTAFTEGQACYWDAANAEVTDLNVGPFIGTCANTGGRAAALTVIWVRMAPDTIANKAVGAGARAGTAFLDWDFAADTGAIGAYYGDALPDNAVVVESGYEVLTTCTSATDAGTGALGIETVDVAGILAAVAISDATDWDAGYKDGIQDGTAANNAVKTTSAILRLQFDIAVEAFTAGKFTAWAQWVVTG